MKNIATTLSFLGAAQEVGRSCFLVDDGKKTLLDAGIQLNEDDEEYPLLETRLMPALDKVVLSHAHLDHSGYLPYLYKQGCQAPAYMTKPTRDLIQVLLADYLRINQGASPYNASDLLAMMRRIQPMEYGQEKHGITFEPAGHILGSAVTLLRGEKTVCYSGDINVRETRLLQGAKLGLKADALIVESTYGTKEDVHASAKSAASELVQNIQKTLDRGGKVLIPTFAIGRGQEMLFLLDSFMRSGLLEKVPIYLDGMVNKVLRIYRHNAPMLKREIQMRILTSEEDPFKSTHYRIPKNKDRSDVLNEEKAIILATSGMLNGGPVLTYLRHLGPDEKNTLLFVGFQAQGTRGREILEGAKEIKLDEDMVPLNLQILQNRFSGHSDQPELLQFIRSMKGLKDIFIVHGEKKKSEALAEAAQKIHKNARIHVPALGEQITI